MPPGGRIDRRKHEVDITERVLEGGLWAAGGSLENARVVVELEFGMRGRPMGTAPSAVEISSIESDDSDRKR
jgi:hypothetical protein